MLCHRVLILALLKATAFSIPLYRGDGNYTTVAVPPTASPATAPIAKTHSDTTGFAVGVGMGDITSAIGEIIMNGYDNIPTVASGIHLRLKARAFIFKGANNDRVVFVNADLGLNSHRLKELVVANLQIQLGVDAAYYSLENIMISATHTHSGPAGYNDNFLYQALTLGVISEARTTIANGITDAIVQAHNDLGKNGADSQLSLNIGELVGSSINRSNKSYINNPAEERAQYTHNVDTTMTELVLKNSNGGLRGILNWFAVHGTSMNNNNSYVSGDNKGFASYSWELQEKLAGNEEFVAAFAQTNSGDATPNIISPTCTNTGEACDGSEHDCNGNVIYCQGHGPGWDVGKDDFFSTKVIGQMQLDQAQKLASTPPIQQSLAGSVQYRHAFVDFTNVSVTLRDGSAARTCLPAMGFSFAGATTDGVSTDLFYQGDNSTAPAWYLQVARDVISLSPLTQDQIDCHFPKEILLNTGYSNIPNAWQPHTLPLQMFLIGRKLAIIGLPTEITTMAGRRLRNSTLTSLISAGAVDSDATIVIAALSNTYSSYTTTFEEYEIQRYEGGSTAYGPHQLTAFQHLYAQMANSFTNPDAAVPSLNSMAESETELELYPGVLFDTSPLTWWFQYTFGNALVQPNPTYKIGATATATFQCAHPRSGPGYTDPATNVPTFMTIETQNSQGAWSTFLTDAGWDTKYHWTRDGFSDSLCQLDWNIGETVPAPPGIYRFRIFVQAKTWLGVRDYTGVSNLFVITV